MKALTNKSDKARKEYQATYQARYYAQNIENIRKRQTEHDSSDESKNKRKQRKLMENAGRTAKDRFCAYKCEIFDGASFVCFSCHRCLFKISVKILDTDDIVKLMKKLDLALITEAGLETVINKTKLILCHSCYQKLNQNKFPSLNINNGLLLDEVPEELSCLTDLEQQLIALSLLFMKIKKLPTSRMRAVVDRYVVFSI